MTLVHPGTDASLPAEAGPVPPGARPRGLAPPVGVERWFEDEAGFRHGPAVRWYPDGALRTVTTYRHGVRHGAYRSWFPDGSPEVEGAFDEDVPDGRWRRWHEAGAVAMEITLVAGRAAGEARSWYPEGALARRWVLVDGWAEGTAETFLPDGARFSVESLRRGLRHGRLEQWLLGQRVLEEEWVDGVRHGAHRAWSWQGHLQAEGAFEGGARHGPWRLYDGRGALLSEGRFEGGRPVGDWRLRSDAGWQTVPAAAVPPLPEPDAVPQPEAEVDPGALVARSGPTPTVLVTGFLGAGKTTAIRHLLGSRPPDQRWVVYVNEFGEVGIDGATLSGSGEGLEVRELAGGCACCTSNRPFVEGVAEAVAALQPDLLILEPTGLADPVVLRASLDRALGGQLDLRAVLCLVDPRQLSRAAVSEHAVFGSQLRAADVVLANRRDLCGPTEIAQLRARLRLLDLQTPVVETTHGRVDPSWIARVAAPSRPPPEPAPGDPSAPHAHAVGGVLPPGPPLRRDDLERILLEMLDDEGIFPNGWLRAKGLFQTDAGPQRVEADRVEGRVVLRWAPTTFDGPDRMECVVLGHAAPDWVRLAAARRD